MGGHLSQQDFVHRVSENYGDKFTILSNYTHGHEKVLVRHNDCGYEWKADPWSLIKKQIKICPMCSNKWKRSTEDFKLEMKKLHGNEYELVGEYVSTNKNVTIKHNSCGKTFLRTPREFKEGVLCPHCRRPNYHENTESFRKRLSEKYCDKYILLGEYKSARENIKVKCTKCNTEWECTPDNLMRGHGCPKCVVSRGEDVISRWLESHGYKYKNQYSDKRCRDKRALRFDFAVFDENGNILTLIEYDGIQHFKPTRFKSSMPNGLCERNLADVQTKDEIKNRFCQENNIPLIRINYKQFSDIDEILSRCLTRAIPC